MPRFFFHTADGEVVPDNEGSVCEDFRQARQAAVRLLAHTLSAQPDLLAGDEDFKVHVVDEKGASLFTAVAMVIDSPSTAVAKKPCVEP